MSVSQRTESDLCRPARSLRIGIVKDGAIVKQTHVNTVKTPLEGRVGGPHHDASVRIVPTTRGLMLMWKAGVTGTLKRGGQAGCITEWIEVTSGQTGVRLHAGDRVRLEVEDRSVLLQGMPHAVVETVDRERFRPLLVRHEDLPFLGMLSVCASAALVFLVGTAGIEPVSSSVYVEPPQRIIQVLLRPPAPPVEAVVSAAELPTTPTLPQPPEPVSTPVLEDLTTPPPVAPTAVAEARATRVERLTQRSAVLAGMDQLQEMLGATDGDAALEEALARSMRPRALAATGGSTGLLAARGGTGRDDATLAYPLRPRGGGLGRTDSARSTSAVLETPAPAVPAARLRIPKTMTVESSQNVMDVVRSRYARQLQQCYQRRLNVTPSLRGRVELSFDVERGVVAFVAVSENQSHDTVLADCIEKRARTWKFRADDAGAFVMPMVFEPG